MKVILAGYNIDLEGLKEENTLLTPEVFSAAYARISRSDKDIPELRAIARKEIQKAREQNRRIIYEMGHHSIAEHSIFNFDIIGISRRAVEKLEAHRLVSYTEASQRYIKWSRNYLVPRELKKSSLLSLYEKTIKEQLSAYHYLIEQLLTSQRANAGNLPNQPKVWEDARYLTPLALKTQLGMTVNGRNLELIIRRCASSNLSELNELGKKLYRLAVKIAPSIILFYQATDYDKKTYQELKEDYCQVKEPLKEIIECRLIDYPKDAEFKLLTALLHTISSSSYDELYEKVAKMSYEEKLSLITKTFKYAKFYDPTLREYEHISLTYELILSAAAYGQLKRHRMATITAQDYDPELGVTIPHSVSKAGLGDYFYKIIRNTEKAYYKIHKSYPEVAPYILTQAHRRRVLLTLNLRELYHIARLRMDQTAQWDIRELTQKMVAEAQKVMPLAMLFCTAKDQYDLVYKKYFKEDAHAKP
jgi:flavin-dependent thymidylate synthase